MKTFFIIAIVLVGAALSDPVDQFTSYASPWSFCGGTGDKCSAELGTCKDEQTLGCPAGFFCRRQNEYYWQCESDSTLALTAGNWGSCGGAGDTCDSKASNCSDNQWAKCAPGYRCVRQDNLYWQCREENPVIKIDATVKDARCGGKGDGCDKTKFKCDDAPFSICPGEETCSRVNEWHWQCKVEATPGPTPAPGPSSEIYEGVISGVAKTTRYWDCRKPTCSWDKYEFKNSDGSKSYIPYPFSKPVKLCDAKGKAIDDNQERDLFEGGKAARCFDQAPKVISDKQAFAFVAAGPTLGLSRDTCCACFEFTFQDPALKGKKLIVQSANTGGTLDTGEHHFDIAIPGGGMGEFTGCFAQFPNMPKENWGNLWGGVPDAAACEKLPYALRRGCKFRFNWMKGIDNPTVNFKRIKCPQKLVDISGCRRNDDEKYAKRK